MTEDHPSRAATIRFFFRGQFWHLILAAVLLVPAFWLVRPSLGDGAWLGVADTTWFWLAVGVPVVHQVLVWLVFRLELEWSVLSRAFGPAAIPVWGAVFMPLLVARPFTLLGLGLSDFGSLVWPRTLTVALGVLLLLPAAYTLWSVLRYFGIPRALGGDHFYARYRELPLVREGAFRWTPNAMYVFVPLALWALALFVQSRAALVAAGFQHAYIWVHYYCTERSDMELIYGQRL